MKRVLVVLTLALTLVISGCGAPKAVIGNPAPTPVPPTPPLVVDLTQGTWTVYESEGQSITGTLTLNLVNNGTCPPVAPGTTFHAKTCYQATDSGTGKMVVTGAGCTEILHVAVGQDANNNLQIAITGNPLAGTNSDYTYFAVGSITSASASNGTWEFSCGGSPASGKWSGTLVQN